MYPGTNEQIKEQAKMTPMQAKLQHKIGNVDAKTFTLKFPKNTPNSTHITGKTGDEADMGVHYEVRVWISERPEDKKNAKKTTAAMTVRKVSTGHSVFQTFPPPPPPHCNCHNQDSVSVTLVRSL